MAIAGLLNTAQAGLPPVQHQGSVQYVSGGIGLDESEALKAAAKDYPLALTFATGRRKADYVADVTVAHDGQGKPVLRATSEGPYMLVKLPAGDYKVSATYSQTQERRSPSRAPAHAPSSVEMTPRRRQAPGRRGGRLDAGEQDGDGEADAGRRPASAARPPAHGQIAQSQPSQHAISVATRVASAGCAARTRPPRRRKAAPRRHCSAPRWRRPPAFLPRQPGTRVVVVELLAARLGGMADRKGTIAAASINHAIIFMGKPLLGCEKRGDARRRAGRMVAQSRKMKSPSPFTLASFPDRGFRCPCCPPGPSCSCPPPCCGPATRRWAPWRWRWLCLGRHAARWTRLAAPAAGAGRPAGAAGGPDRPAAGRPHAVHRRGGGAVPAPDAGIPQSAGDPARAAQSGRRAVQHVPELDKPLVAFWIILALPPVMTGLDAAARCAPRWPAARRRCSCA